MDHPWADSLRGYLKTICILVLFFPALLLGPGNACAKKTTSKDLQDFRKALGTHFSLNGYIENESAFQLNAPQKFVKLQNLLQLEIKGDLKNWGQLYGLLWSLYDPVYDLYADDFPAQVRQEYRSNFTADEAFDQTLREIYLDISLETMDVRLGKQQVVWGEAIGLRITDVVNPQDFREFILDDFIDSRIPIWMAKANYYIRDYSMEVLWIPFFEPNRAALEGSVWEWTFNRIQPPPGTTLNLLAPVEPDPKLKNSELGARLSGLVGGWNLSASYLYVWDDTPARHTRFDPQTATLNVLPQFHRLHILGFTFANAFGRFVPRGEFAYNLEKRFSTADAMAVDGLEKKNFLYYMLGTDYSVSDYLFNLQFIQKIILDYEEGLYEERVQNNFSFWVQAKFMNETLKPEFLVLYEANHGSWLIRPKIAYDLTDHLALTIGTDILVGDPRSFLGQFDHNDRIYVECKYSF